MSKKLFSLLIITILAGGLKAQELQAKLTVQAGKVSTQVDKKVFQTLQTALTTFLNNRKWTPDTYQPGEKIKCNFLINIDEDKGNNVFKGSLTVQAARPIYGTSYESPLINFQDPELVFKYVEFQPIEFNENRVLCQHHSWARLRFIRTPWRRPLLSKGVQHRKQCPRGPRRGRLEDL
jgi:hypothetical protein